MADLSPLFEHAPDASEGDTTTVVLHVHVAPGAGRSVVVGRHGDALKVRVAAPPVAGRANQAATELLAETFGVKEKDVELVSGETSRTKRFKLSRVELEEFEKRLRLLVNPTERPRPTP